MTAWDEDTSGAGDAGVLEAEATTADPLAAAQSELVFRCPAELMGRIPSPIPAARGLPDWLRTMPAEAFSALVDGVDDTLKRCPPFVDAMSEGFLIPLVSDLHVRDGAFTWDADWPQERSLPYPRAPIGLHDPAQTTGTPFHDPDAFTVKLHNLWTLEAPRGWSVLFTHPVNREDLPFRTLTGLVDCDRYRDGFIHFPAVWRDMGFTGTLPAGTPIAQAFPIRRDRLAHVIAPMSPAQTQAARDLAVEMGRERGVYRKRFRR